jgi:hypothetical protein
MLRAGLLRTIRNKGDEMIGLKWYEPQCLHYNFFSRGRVAIAIARIAGGEPEEYLSRAGRMIVVAKKLGYIECAAGSKHYYRFRILSTPFSEENDHDQN